MTTYRSYPVNRPTVLSAGAGTFAGLTVTTVPFDLTLVTPGDQGVLTLNDAATLAAASVDNVVWTGPTAALRVGVPVLADVTLEAGLVVSAVPAGVSAAVSFG